MFRVQVGMSVFLMTNLDEDWIIFWMKILVKVSEVLTGSHFSV